MNDISNYNVTSLGRSLKQLIFEKQYLTWAPPFINDDSCFNANFKCTPRAKKVEKKHPENTRSCTPTTPNNSRGRFECSSFQNVSFFSPLTELG